MDVYYLKFLLVILDSNCHLTTANKRNNLVLSVCI